MIKNIPTKLRTGLNLGYAFVNFTRSVGALRFFRCFQSFSWKSFDSRKVCEMKLARVQTQTRSSPFDFIENDESELHGRTSVMIKSIPSKLRTKLIKLLDMHCDKENKMVDEKNSKSCQDMPDFRTGLNLENFTRFAGVVLFFKLYHKFDWKSFDSNKVCEIKLARVQGKQGLVMHFKDSYFRCETDVYLPVKFSPAARDGSLSCAFPAGVAKNQKMSPNARPFSSSLQYSTKLLFSSPPYFPLPLLPPPSPVFEFHPPFAHHFVALHTGLSLLGYEFVYFTRLVGQYGSSDATNIFLGALSQVKYVKSRTSLASLGVSMTTVPSRKCFCRQRITSSHLQCYFCWQEEAYEEFKHVLLACIYAKDDQTSPVANEADIQALAHVVELTRQGVVDSLEFSKGNLFQAFQVAMGRRLGVDEPLLMKLMRATLHTHNEWFRLQMCKDLFEGLLKIDSLKEIKTPLIIDEVSKKNTDNSTSGSSQITSSTSNRMVEDGNSPTQVSSGDVICDETAILKVMNGVQEKSMAVVDKISDIVENSPHKIFIGGISEALSSNMLMEIASAFGILRAYRFQFYKKINGSCISTFNPFSGRNIYLWDRCNDQQKAVRSLNCHQYQRNDEGEVIHCQKCNTRQFCLQCNRWYPQFSPDDIAESYLVCRGICNCEPCLHKYGTSAEKQSSKERITSREKVNYYQYMVHALLPILKQFDQEQKLEMALEARIQGVSPSDICLQKLDCYSDERVCW
ncbi:hypothetical protein GIB67_014966 [Kingdonia uniflora]|uniref:Mei2-like C-terminal RNA recognition motif domain-containing protein n=1 Tax=Kingdonia uniflora TaxID=39325 RepID=A0A7J7MTN8_9MAGN|nr:hypothetical protein GIB67_014966 [Kingdonia uniflora]